MFFFWFSFLMKRTMLPTTSKTTSPSPEDACIIIEVETVLDGDVADVEGDLRRLEVLAGTGVDVRS